MGLIPRAGKPAREPWITNYSWVDIQCGDHLMASKTWLIGMSTPDLDFPFPREKFDRMLRVWVGDVNPGHEWACTEQVAQEIIDFLKAALDEGASVVVHCTAGVNRSGSVVRVGEMMGFNELGRYRGNNVAVNMELMKALGWHPLSDRQAWDGLNKNGVSFT